MLSEKVTAPEMTTPPRETGWSRRGLLRLGGAAALGAAAAAMPALAAAAPQVKDDSPIEPNAGGWRTWALASGDQLRLPPPPGQAATRDELAQLLALEAARDTPALDLINFWDSGAPGYRWDDLALTHTLSKGLGGVRPRRVAALLHAAIYDATIAAWDSKYAHNRQRPSERDPRLTPVLPVPASPSYPCEHSATAGAAAAILTHLYPADTAIFAAGAEEVGRCRQVAGLAYPSDVAAGLALGRAVADLVIARAQADGSDKPWTGTLPTGPDKWYPAQGTTPGDVTAGTWRPWLLTAHDQLRPAAPPAVGSPERARELAEVKNFPRTNATNVTATFWEYNGGLRGHIYWHTHLRRQLAEYRWDGNPPRAARAYALLALANHDAGIACFEAKYAYLAPRPFQLDPALTTVIATPNHPSYPSAHGAFLGASSEIMAYLFPREAGLFFAQAQVGTDSRLWAGIHYRSDDEAGLAQGRAAAQLFIAHAREDGAI